MHSQPSCACERGWEVSIPASETRGGRNNNYSLYSPPPDPLLGDETKTNEEAQRPLLFLDYGKDRFLLHLSVSLLPSAFPELSCQSVTHDGNNSGEHPFLEAKRRDSSSSRPAGAHHWTIRFGYEIQYFIEDLNGRMRYLKNLCDIQIRTVVKTYSFRKLDVKRNALLRINNFQIAGAWKDTVN
jgi:hypothetical protein